MTGDAEPNYPEAIVRILRESRPTGYSDASENMQFGYDAALNAVIAAGVSQGWENIGEGFRLYREEHPPWGVIKGTITKEKVSRIGEPGAYVDPTDESRGRWVPVYSERSNRYICVPSTEIPEEYDIKTLSIVLYWYSPVSEEFLIPNVKFVTD